MLWGFYKHNCRPPGWLVEGKQPKICQKHKYVWKRNGFGQHLDNTLTLLRSYKIDYVLKVVPHLCR